MIYYVEDDRNIRELVVYTLCGSGLRAEGFSCAADFWNAMHEQKPELVLLDIMLPGQDGISILKELRSNGATAELPVLMLTAKGSVYDKVVGLDSGADDYLAKPFEMIELISRVKALLRRSARKREKELIRIGSIVIDDGKHTVQAGGQAVTLTLKEYELLKFLAQNCGFAFTREQLLAKIWGYDYGGGTRTVDVHIQTRRQKLGDSGEQIQTVRGVGYRMRDEL